MYTQCKYVVLEQEYCDSTRENIYIFPSNIIHKSVSFRMKGNPISGGFISKNRETGELFCTGKSESLGVRSRPKDNMLLKELLP